ncbi:unnamed protein product [Effrenium voratum]|nr:unnamed protein product [Effrenium voratum]
MPSLVDVSSLTKVAKDDLGLLEQPKVPKFRTALAQIYVRNQPYGGSDKSSNGHRYDSIPFSNGMINAGMSCQLIHYVHEEHAKFFDVCKSFDAIIVRCNPGQIKADGGDQAKFDDGMRAMRKLGIQVWPSPDVMEFMGAKDALCKVAHLNIGLEDTLAYYSPEEFAAGFKKTMAFQPRVIKQNRGSSGEGIWIIKLKKGDYCKSYGDRSCADDEVLDMMEANDNHSEEHTVAEFIEFCANGRTNSSGTWTSKGVGKYLEGGKAAGGQLVDQRFCPRIVEGELRYNMVVDTLVGIIHKKPKEGGISAVGGTGSIYTFYGPEETKFKALTDNFLKRDLPHVMPSLGLSEEPIPLWWTTDFILASPEGTPADQEKWIVGEFNCSCVGISKCLAAYCKDDTPQASFKDIAADDLKEAQTYGDMMGSKALGILDAAACQPVDVSSLTRVAKDFAGLRPQPSSVCYKTALAQIYVRSAPYGGSDKSSNGHRYDSIPFANGMINAGMSCQLIHYTHEEHAKFFDVCKHFAAIIVRCNPGQIKADGGDQAKFDDGMRAMRKLGIQVWPSPDVMEFMGAKDALCKVAHLNIGLEDTLAYYSPEEFAAGFKKTMAFQPRVIKQNRGSSGEGIWIIKLKKGDYCKSYGDRSCADDEVLDMMEANDNHSEEHTVAEFIEFCASGRTSKSGTWTSKGVGKYLEGGKAAGGQLVDQRFCPRIVEGELRYNMVVDTLVGIIHKKPKEGGISAVGGTGSIYTYYGPEETKFKALTENFLKRDLPHVMPSLGLAEEPIPLWWTTDFILASPEGTPADQEKWIVGEFNCSCVGISKCLAAYCKDDTPKASYNDIEPEDLKAAQAYGDLMGVKALGILQKSGTADGPVSVAAISQVAKDNLGLMSQPASPKFKCALAQIYVRNQPYGGSDKSSNGHRYDSIPFANGMINAGMSCQLIHYVHEEHAKFFDVCKNFAAIIVRCNPGQIKADGGDQAKFDDGMRAMRKLGIQVWPSPDVMEFMGAKDALCKVAHLNIGLEDTLAYYSPEEFAAGFKKTMAFQPRVIKQNRGSSGEGIWIIKLKKGDYCKSYGDRSCADDEVLDMMEANDNHSEEHTVAEFIEFCASGRTSKSGTWTSKGVGKYLEGGKAAGGQLVDQRFCPRIVEGELRYNMVVDTLVGIIHKKPKEGGISAVGGTGSIYTYYGPEETKFKALTENFLKRDLPHVMPSLGLAEEPIPLWWTTDFILASPEGTPADQEKWIVGEFNCSCVGISKCLAAYCKDDTPKASYNDIEPEDLKAAQAYGDLMGVKALGILQKSGTADGPVSVAAISQVAKDNLGLMSQPASPKFKCALAQIYVRNQPYGGSDKSSNGHRYDSIPFANGMINAGMSCQLIHYVHEEHAKFFDVCKNFAAIIVRCNPGQIKADGGDQAKFDDGMRAMRKLGIQVWPSPDVMEFMGAKDALCKVAHLNIGLEDTLAYYSPEEFAAGFKKTMAFQPRVIKQNRGSSGEGIWIIKLKKGDYCKSYGDRSCADDEVLDMMEANDNHSEEHTVAEFIEFCASGRTSKSGTWTSKGVGKYLEGGKAAGGQLVDQRFCPRIVEGELRYNMVVDTLVGIIHKKPKEGGISAVGGTGSIYTYYGPEETKFKALTENFLKRDLPHVMPSLGLAEEPIPLWWTTDFILASPEGTPADQEKWIVGEFNCSCVGISKCLAAYCKDDTPKASYNDIEPEDLKAAQAYGDLMGVKALGILSAGGAAGASAGGASCGRLVLLRHGAVQMPHAGWADVELSEQGKAEAASAGQLLKSAKLRCDIAFASVLRRSVRTAWTALMECDHYSLPVVNTWRLNERHFGDMQGKEGAVPDSAPTPVPTSDSRHPANDALYRHVAKATLPSGESVQHVVDRVLSFYSDSVAPCVMAGKTVLVSGHGASLHAICQLLEGDAKVADVAPGVPLVYEVDANLKVLRKYYLDDALAQKKLSEVK